jgi:transcriptional regulator with XRE-family HTH domain
VRSAALIREARLRAGLTQAELAERTGRDRSVIARWEQGAVAPSVETLLELVRAGGFDLPLLLVTQDTSVDERLRAKPAAHARAPREPARCCRQGQGATSPCLNASLASTRSRSSLPSTGSASATS